MAHSSNEHSDISRVMLWVTPRSASTSFLKCMTFVPDTLAFHEPYWQVWRYGEDEINRRTIKEFKQKYKSANVPVMHQRDVEGGYFAADKGFSWVKEQLKATPEGKKMIFCKDIIGWPIHGNYERLPSGFQHTFLTRNPYLTFDSLKRAVNNGISDEKKLQLTDLPAFYMPEGKFFKEQYDLYKYLKETLGQTPPVIDVDDLLSNPAGIMRAYFAAIGVPYNDDYLHWKPGTECMDQLWVICKEVVWYVRRWQVMTFASTGFGSPRICPDRKDLPEDVVHYSDLCMKYYEEMYANRLKPL